MSGNFTYTDDANTLEINRNEGCADL